MQHPEEGTIHAWLDGALPADEAAQFEAHVAECAECRGKVADARGFIAASSRILTALDDVPSGVIPVSQPVRRMNRVYLRAAAAVLVVATGGLLIMRDGQSDSGVPVKPAVATGAAAQPTSTVAAAQVAPEPPTAPLTAPVRDAPVRNADRPRVAAVQARPVSPDSRLIPPPSVIAAPQVVATAPSASILGGSATGASRVYAPRTTGMTARAATPSPTVQQGKTSASSDTTIDIVLTRDVMHLESAVTTGVASTVRSVPMPLKIVKVDTIAQGKRTTYEVAPNKFATLLELGTQRPVPGASADLRRAEVASAAAPSITWTDASGKTLILSGAFSPVELQQIRERIEQARSRKE